jgi:hypothetical protein
MSNPALDAILTQLEQAAVVELESLVTTDGPGILAAAGAAGIKAIDAIEAYLIALVPKNGILGAYIGKMADAEISALATNIINSLGGEEKALLAFALSELAQLGKTPITL